MFANFHAALALQLAEGATAAVGIGLDRSPEEIVDMLRSSAGTKQLSKESNRAIGPVDWPAFDDQLSAMNRTGASALCWWDVDYPECLRSIPEAPALLFYKGDPRTLSMRGIGVVGTRKPTPGGVSLARGLGRGLAAAGVTVVSGLARGIDTAAHVGSLEGPGPSLAVIGTGIDIPYPAENAALMVDVARAGCVVTEQLMGMHAERWVFPRRNRMISGFSHAVVVVQGGVRSGALITARWALEQGRDVGAVPGFPGDFRSAGPNGLLKQGAFVVEDVRDVLDAVPALEASLAVVAGERARGLEVSDATARRVLEAIGNSPTGIDDIAAAMSQDVIVVGRAMSELEIDGLVTRDALGRYSRA